MSNPKGGKPPNPHGEAYGLLKNLGKDVMAEIDVRLMDGDSGHKIAAWLQDERKLLTSVKADTIRKTVERYRQKELREKTFKRISEIHRNVSFGTIATKMNALASMEEVALIQRARVGKMLALEEGKPMLIGATREELKTLHALLADLAKLQLETGVLNRAIKSVKGSYTDEATGETKKFEWTEAQEKLLQELVGVPVETEAA
jgi:hypothetical protein